MHELHEVYSRLFALFSLQNQILNKIAEVVLSITGIYKNVLRESILQNLFNLLYLAM